MGTIGIMLALSFAFDSKKSNQILTQQERWYNSITKEEK